MSKKIGEDSKTDMDEFFDDVYQLYEDGKTDEALEKLNTIDESHPEYSKASFFKAMISPNEDEDVDELFEQFLISEVRKEYGSDVADAILNGDFKGSINGMIDHNNPDDLFLAGLTDYEFEDYEEALEFFDLSLKLDSKQSEVLYYKSLSLAHLGKLKKAVTFIDKAIKIDPNDDRFWNDKGNFLATLNHVNKAHKCFDKAIKINPNDPIIWANKGFLYREYGKYDDALNCYDTARELDPSDISSIVGKADVYMDMGDEVNAEKLLKEASKIDDEDFDYLCSMAHFKWNQLKLEESLEYWDKCLEIDEEHPEIWMYKSMIYMMLGDEEKAEECIDEAAEMDPFIISQFNELLEE